MEPDAEQDLDIRTPEVFEKFKAASEIANNALSEIIQQCVPGKLVFDLCSLGDRLMNEGIAAYTKEKVEKGIAFPTCISVNHCVGHYSPVAGDNKVLQEEDVVKIDLGVHIDGFIATGAHTVIATSTPENVVTGKKADVICAAHFAAECALRLFRPGKTNKEVTEAIQKVAEMFHCNPVEGVLSHQMKRFVIDGSNVVMNKETAEQTVEEVTFEEYDVYCFDIVISTGEGKSREGEVKTTVFKRAVEQNYNLKMQASRAVFSEINKKYPTVPFSLRSLGDAKRARLGMTEILKHELVESYPVLFEKDGEFVAQFKFTALITPTQTMKLINQALPFVKSDFQITDPAIASLLSQTTKRGKKKNKKRQKKKALAGGKVAQAAAPSKEEN